MGINNLRAEVLWPIDAITAKETMAELFNRAPREWRTHPWMIEALSVCSMIANACGTATVRVTNTPSVTDAGDTVELPDLREGLPDA